MASQFELVHPRRMTTALLLRTSGKGIWWSSYCLIPGKANFPKLLKWIRAWANCNLAIGITWPYVQTDFYCALSMIQYKDERYTIHNIIEVITSDTNNPRMSYLIWMATKTTCWWHPFLNCSSNNLNNFLNCDMAILYWTCYWAQKKLWRAGSQNQTLREPTIHKQKLCEYILPGIEYLLVTNKPMSNME